MQSSLRAENNVWVYGAICGLNSLHSRILRVEKIQERRIKKESAGIQQIIMKQQSLENGMKASNFEKPSFSP